MGFGTRGALSKVGTRGALSKLCSEFLPGIALSSRSTMPQQGTTITISGSYLPVPFSETDVCQTYFKVLNKSTCQFL